MVHAVAEAGSVSLFLLPVKIYLSAMFYSHVEGKIFESVRRPRCMQTICFIALVNSGAGYLKTPDIDLIQHLSD